MSDSTGKIIPQNPFYKIPETRLQKCKEFLETNACCDSIETQCSITPIFVDCGGNLESIACPDCHSALSFNWWGEAIQRNFITSG